MILLREAGQAAMPWKNGGGTTREICRMPADGGDFDWRLSLATIARPGPFSAFDGYRRTLVLVRGAGVELDFQAHGRARLTAQGQMVSFDGAWQTSCTLIDGPSSDLNLITATGRVESEASVRQISSPQRIPTAGWADTLVCCLAGSGQLETKSGEVARLEAVDTARCRPADGTLTCRTVGSAPARLFVARVRPLTGSKAG